MNSNNEIQTEGEPMPTRGKWGKYAGIALIALSITALVATPRTMRWLILLEGALAFTGIVLFAYARIQFWREVSRYRLKQ